MVIVDDDARQVVRSLILDTTLKIFMDHYVAVAMASSVIFSRRNYSRFCEAQTPSSDAWLIGGVRDLKQVETCIQG